MSKRKPTGAGGRGRPRGSKLPAPAPGAVCISSDHDAARRRFLERLKRPTVGDRAWRAEWCSRLAFYEDSTDVDRDACKMSARYFETRDEARAFAERIWPATHETFGIVDVYEIEFYAYDEADARRYPHAGYWQSVTEYGEIFSGEWES